MIKDIKHLLMYLLAMNLFDVFFGKCVFSTSALILINFFLLRIVWVIYIYIYIYILDINP